MTLVFLITFIVQEGLTLDNESEGHLMLKLIDDAVVIFFTLEYVTRFSCSPNKKRFLKNLMNTIDLLAIIPAYIQLFLEQISDVALLGMAGKLVRLLRILRTVRIFKLIRHVTGLQALMNTVYEAYKELRLLLLLVGLAELTFTVLIFYAEKETPKATKNIFKYDLDDTWSLADCLWFCMMTLTTVGNNRKYPSSIFGQLVGAVCALVGVFIVSLPIPIVVHSFARCYKNQIWRNEVSRRRSEIVDQIRRRNLVAKLLADAVKSIAGWMKPPTVTERSAATTKENC